jgi:asparagine synthase (glutamine-hydrolysing)
LKKACEGILPHDVIYRKKVGFAAPTSRWFKKGAYFKPYFQDLLEKKRQSAGAHLNIDGINKLFEQNLEANQELSMQLWVLQNVLATDVL